MISVIIPLFNKEDFILETLKSVLSQTYTEFEIIVVNDGSIDNSLGIVNGVKDERIKAITINNGGVSNARNVGIDKAKFDWVALLDADDTWEQNYLQKAVDILIMNSEVDVVATNYYLDYNFKKVVALKNRNGFIESYLKNPCFSSSTVIIRKNVFVRLGVFNPKLKYGEDQHLWFRLGANCIIYFNSSPLVNYRMEDHQVSNSLIKDRDFSADLVSVIDDIEIYTEEWQVFKTNYLMRYLRPYYIYDDHLLSVKTLINKIPLIRKLSFPYLFYALPRFIIKPLYKWFYFLKYTNTKK